MVARGARRNGGQQCCRLNPDSRRRFSFKRMCKPGYSGVLDQGWHLDVLTTLKIMVTTALIAAAVLIGALGIAHSILGEKHIIRWLLSHDLPPLPGGRSFTAGTIRFAWHITSVLFLGLAGVLLVIASDAPASTVLMVIGSTFILSAVLPIVFTRGRHISWVVLLVSGAICLGAVAAM